VLFVVVYFYGYILPLVVLIFVLVGVIVIVDLVTKVITTTDSGVERSFNSVGGRARSEIFCTAVEVGLDSYGGGGEVYGVFEPVC